MFSAFGVEWVTGHRSHLVDHDVIAPLPGATVRLIRFSIERVFMSLGDGLESAAVHILVGIII